MWPVAGTHMLFSTSDSSTAHSDRKATRMISRILRQTTTTKGPDNTVEEWRAWQWLRLRFNEDHDLWTGRELAHLRFLRWLAQTGRLADDGGPAQGSAEPRWA
jgi:hypothetical protein